tara:strand:+ start:2916 stop:3350 length:435 start_codon:yes stop_codon:yes gene_type:complete
MSDEKYSVIREHNYTISVVDRKGNKLSFRDITGRDLEFLEEYIDEEKDLTIESVINILKRINLSEIKIERLTPRVIKEVFEIVGKEILCNFITKFKWLEVCYALQNNSFVAIDYFESQPMTKVMAMIQVHENAIAEMNKPRDKK